MNNEIKEINEGEMKLFKITGVFEAENIDHALEVLKSYFSGIVDEGIESNVSLFSSILITPIKDDSTNIDLESPWIYSNDGIKQGD